MISRKYVVDTSLFVNPYSRKHFGATPGKAVKKFISMVKKTENISFYMPPSVFKELGNFVEKKYIEELEIQVKKKAPNTFAIYLPAAVFYDFIDDVRIRINKGLRLAEEFAKDNRPDNEDKLKKLRDKYRSAMRTGILDSKEDFELVLLAKELEGTLVTSDEGVLKFANKTGCEWIKADKFYALLKSVKKK